MEMEHINENTIRVLIKSEDLADRGITFLDLLGNHAEIENFFYSILEEVDIDEEFKGSEAVTFQVLPKGDGLELFISKNMPLDADDFENLDDIGGDPQDVSEYLKRTIAQQLQQPEEDEGPSIPPRTFVMEMVDFEQMIQLANEVVLEEVETKLFKLNEFYFLEVSFLDDELSEADIENVLANLAEYARRSVATPELLAEHGQVIMGGNALGTTRHFFQM